jgi:hypothetical protein
MTTAKPAAPITSASAVLTRALDEARTIRANSPPIPCRTTITVCTTTNAPNRQSPAKCSVRAPCFPPNSFA